MPRSIRGKPLVLVILAVTAALGDRVAGADWEVRPDPPREAMSLELTDDFRIDFPRARFSSSERAFFSGSRARFILLAQDGESPLEHRTLWDLKRKQPIARLEGGPSGFYHGVLSPDGRWFAQTSRSAIRVWALDGSKREKSIATRDFERISFEFLSDDRLLTISSDPKGSSLVVWDLNSAEAIQRQNEEIEIEPTSVAVSPGRNWLAALCRNDLVFIDLKSLKARATIALDTPKFGTRHFCDGMAFSPDGRELAGVLHSHRDYAVRVWDMTTGRETLRIPIPGSTSRRFNTSANGEFHWLPDGRGWLVSGETLVHRAAKRTVATITTARSDSLSMPPRPIDSTHLAMVAGDEGARTLSLLKIPYDRIEAALKAVASDKPAALRPGQSVALRVEVAAVRFADKATVATELRETFRSAIKVSPLKLVADAPVALTIRYEESAAKPIRYEPLPFAVPGTHATAPRLVPDSEQGAATGAGFILTSDGYAATCAQVVGEAKTVQVRIGGRTHEANVVAKDAENDLALLKIDAKNLDTLPLADSEKVKTGETLRVFDYPSSDGSGETVKATPGALVSVILRNKRRLFQVDTPMNPGNSGGPTVDEMGNVVGATTAKFVGRKDDNHVLVAPSNTLKKLLDDHKVTPTSAPSATKLDGAALLKRAAGAVVKVVGKPTFTSTVIRLDVSLTAKGRKEALWSQTLTTAPLDFLTPSKPSDESIRESAFRNFAMKLGSITLPYYISADDPTLRLPIVLEVPK